MDRLFESFGLGAGRWPLRPVAFPAVNMWENQDSVFVEAELPGVKQEDIEVYAVGDELTIKGRREPLPDDKFTYHRRERGTGEFSRVVTLPCEVDADKVDAVLQNGVLTVQLPKAAAAKPRQITVKVS